MIRLNLNPKTNQIQLNKYYQCIKGKTLSPDAVTAYEHDTLKKTKKIKLKRF